MPSLRIDQSDLKCKNGCDYFGNPQWQGYCSKCHREQMLRQRKAEKASSSTLPKSEQKKPERGLKLTSHSSFSKFEEKRQRQSDTLKKTNLLKFSVFKKSNTQEEHETAEKRPPAFKIPSMVNEGMKTDFVARFPNLSTHVDRDARIFVHSFIMDVMKQANVLTVDELSERVQRQYQRYMKHMDTASHYEGIDSDTKELLIDFVEKHAMTYLHELPSVVFSPLGTDDERLDRAMAERIQQLAWVGEHHLECRLDRSDPECRLTLYKAISELLGMDGARSPGGKLARARRCCRHVLRLCARAPASADELLPALIFTVLKANPPRLISNINFVTRFCNAQRLMTGEGGYYFTNLCCAVSFIENLTAESLSMDKKEFDCYMAMPASIGGSSWAAALSLCGAAREAAAWQARAAPLLLATERAVARADLLERNANTLEEQIAKKVQDVLAKTPLEIKPRTELPRIGKFKRLSTPSRIDTTTATEQPKQEKESTTVPQTEIESVIIPQTETESAAVPETEITSVLVPQTEILPATIPQSEIEVPQTTDIPIVLKEPQTIELPSLIDETKNIEIPLVVEELQPRESPPVIEEPKLNILGFEVIERDSPSKSPQLEQTWDLKNANSMEMLTPSPLGFSPFDSRSIDELLTPDEYAVDQLAPGLSNINYDIDLSDFSGDNSLADDVPKPDAKDPFSPDGLKMFDPFAPQTSSSLMKALETFDEFSLIDDRNKDSDTFEVVHRNDPFSPILSNKNTVVDKKDSIMDGNDSPTAACLLPSPLQPQSSGKPT